MELGYNINDFSAIILCGGKSGRMGTDKAFVELNKKPLFMHIISIIEPLAPDIVLVAADPQKYRNYESLTVITDDPRVAGKGPLAGIFSGLEKIRGARAFIIACDMPFITTGAIMQLAGCYERCNAPGVLLSRCNGQIEPLFSIYSKKAAPVLLEMLLQGQSRVRRVADYIDTCYCDFADESIFCNINNPEDLERARLLLSPDKKNFKK